MHPIAFEMDYTIERNRLTTFFRLIVAIPWLIWLSIYGIATVVIVVISWFALLFTTRFPESLYRFISGYLEVSTKIGAFIVLATDEWPLFMPSSEGEYPVQVKVAPPASEYRRSRTFFKHVLVIPQQILLGGLGNVLGGAAFVTWWRVMVTGRQSATMHDAMRVSLAYSVRSAAFSLLLTEIHPRLLDLPPQEIPADAPSMPGPKQLPQTAA